jgi:hypothetical protein
MSTIEQSTIVEPNADDSIEQNLNPSGRAYYAFSTLLCTPSSLSPGSGRADRDQRGNCTL